jgi:hypothetical protein
MELFKQLGSSEKQSAFFVLVVIGLETSKVIALILAKSEMETKKITRSNITHHLLLYQLEMVDKDITIFSNIKKYFKNKKPPCWRGLKN